MKAPQPGLAPIGRNYYATPYGKAPTPQGFPLSPVPFGLGVNLVVDKCNQGIQVNPVMAFVKLPPLQVVWRNPKCNPVPPPLLKNPVAPPKEDYSHHNWDKPKLLVKSWFLNGGFSSSYQEAVGAIDGPVTFYRASGRKVVSQVVNVHIPVVNDDRTKATSDNDEIPIALITIKDESDSYTRISGWSGTAWANWGWDVTYKEIPPIDEFDSNSRHFTMGYDMIAHIYLGIGEAGTDWQERARLAREYLSRNPQEYRPLSPLDKAREDIYIVGSQEELDSILEYLYKPGKDYLIKNENSTGVEIGYYVPHLFDVSCNLVPPIEPNKMDCCDELKRLLKLTLKRIGDLPVEVPDLFTKQEPSYESIPSLSELMLWQMTQIDALLGAFPIEIKIEDEDITKEGNQEKKLTIPNTAEALAEMLGMIISIRQESLAILKASINGMVEAGQAKQTAIITLDVAKANAEYLGYKLEQIEKEIPMTFTPGEKKLDKILEPKEKQKIVTYENKEERDINDDFKPLKEMAARWNAQNWRKISTGNAVEDMKRNLQGIPEALKDKHKEKKKQDFDNFTEQAERGFVDIPGVTDTEHPWGKDYESRPRIRILNQEDSKSV